MEAESQPQSQYRGGGGAALHMSSEDGRRLCITGMSLLVDPSAAHVRGGELERVVHVWAEVVGQEKRATIDIGTLSSSSSAAAVVPVVPPVVLAGEFVLRHDLGVAAAVRLNVRVLAPPDHQCSEVVEAVLVLGVDNVEDVVAMAVDEEDEEEDDVAVVGGVEYEPMSEDDVAERYDSDNDDDDDVDDVSSRVRARESSSTENSVVVVVVPDGELVGPARFAVVGNTAGFMRIAAASAATATMDDDDDDDQETTTTTTTSGSSSKDEIVVLYRYTRFSRPARSGRRGGVEACRRTKHHRLRFFTAASSSDMASSSLSWAGSSLGALVYPKLFRQELAELWATLLAAATTNAAAVLRRAGGGGGRRIQVIVDVGILRREDDCTAERMAHVRGELAHRVLEPWPAACSCCCGAGYHVDMELNLPEPVPLPAAKCGRRRIAGDEDEEEEECCVCFEVMEYYGYGGGVAAWPGCGHVFHGSCVRKTLERSQMCPLCRRRLSDPLHKSAAV